MKEVLYRISIDMMVSHQELWRFQKCQAVVMVFLSLVIEKVIESRMFKTEKATSSNFTQHLKIFPSCQI